MALRVIGAGLGRTGTLSLRFALERLLGGTCYHMTEIFMHPEHMATWRAAAEGRLPDWKAFFADYPAAVDWPAVSFWRELMAAFPDALVLFSVRDAESWWKSAHGTIFPAISEATGEWHDMVFALFAARFTTRLDDRDACIAAFERHNAAVRAEVPRSRLLEWHPGDGWEPICKRLGLPVPTEPFPHANSSEEFRARYR